MFIEFRLQLGPVQHQSSLGMIFVGILCLLSTILLFYLPRCDRDRLLLMILCSWILINFDLGGWSVGGGVTWSRNLHTALRGWLSVAVRLIDADLNPSQKALSFITRQLYMNGSKQQQRNHGGLWWHKLCFKDWMIAQWIHDWFPPKIQRGCATTTLFRSRQRWAEFQELDSFDRHVSCLAWAQLMQI